MKGREFIRKLKKSGAVIVGKRGKGGHVLVEYKGKKTTVPFHGDADLGSGLLKNICAQLGLDPRDVL
ncbi:MAG: type II toxin-antitoxin system HicA family toxin [Thermodesulfobacteriota bacterium]|nr:type II toxin-antitoxin system HicA family toxin [Thermodesulfobacteriota bacterium]